MRHPLSIVTAGLVVLAGCASDDAPDDATPEVTAPEDGVADDGSSDATGEGDDPTSDPTDEATDDPTPESVGATTDEAAGEAAADDVAGWELVTCEADDLTVDHPSSWTAHESDDVPPCRVFHPEPIEDFEGESLHYAVRLYIDPVAFEDATGSPSSQEVSREELTVDGRDAVVIERRSDGEALLPEGERSYTYTVDLDGMILVGTTSTVGDTDYDVDRRVLDRMMETLTVDVAE